MADLFWNFGITKEKVVPRTFILEKKKFSSWYYKVCKLFFFRQNKNT